MRLDPDLIQAWLWRAGHSQSWLDLAAAFATAHPDWNRQVIFVADSLLDFAILNHWQLHDPLSRLVPFVNLTADQTRPNLLAVRVSAIHELDALHRARVQLRPADPSLRAQLLVELANAALLHAELRHLPDAVVADNGLFVGGCFFRLSSAEAARLVYDRRFELAEAALEDYLRAVDPAQRVQHPDLVRARVLDVHAQLASQVYPEAEAL